MPLRKEITDNLPKGTIACYMTILTITWVVSWIGPQYLLSTSNANIANNFNNSQTWCLLYKNVAITWVSCIVPQYLLATANQKNNKKNTIYKSEVRYCVNYACVL